MKACFYRQDLNILKTIAIFAVVFYHFGELLKSANYISINYFDGGFVGVDVFFVISGFLASATIFYKLDNNSFRVKDFYYSRVKRIFPPLLFLCLFCSFIGYFVLLPYIYLELNIESLNAILSIGNFRFANSGGYFAVNNSEKILLHTWYLCILVQFYIVYPILISLLVKNLKTSKLHNIGHFVFFTFIILFTISVFITYKSNKGYLLSQCRLFELFFGASLYFYKDALFKLKFFNLHLGLMFLGYSILIYSIFSTELKNGAWHTYNALLPMIGTSLVLLVNYKRVDALHPFELIGKCSYSFYLWHWPLFIFALRFGFSSKTLDCFIFSVVAIIFAVFSYNFFEKNNFKLKTIFILFTLIILNYGISKYTQGKNYLSQYLVTDAQRFNSDDWNIELPNNRTPKVIEQDGDQIVYQYGYQKDVPHIFVVGDSHALHYLPYLRNTNVIPMYYKAVGGTMCYGKHLLAYKHIMNNSVNDRKIFYRQYVNTINLLKPNDKVIFANFWSVHYLFYQKEFNAKPSDKALKNYMEGVISDLDEQIKKHPDIEFYIIGDGIVANSFIVSSLKTDLHDSFLRIFIGSQRFNSTENMNKKVFDIINKSLREYATSRKNTYFIDRTIPLLNKNNTYRIYDDNGAPLYRDDNHYTSVGGEIVFKYILKELGYSLN